MGCMVSKEKGRSVRVRFDSERCTLVVLLHDMDVCGQ